MEKETTENKGIYLREINIPELISKLKKGWKSYLISLSITFALSMFIILSVPRYYRCEVKLAPESSASNLGNIGALASSMGINMGNLENVRHPSQSCPYFIDIQMFIGIFRNLNPSFIRHLSVTFPSYIRHFSIILGQKNGKLRADWR